MNLEAQLDIAQEGFARNFPLGSEKWRIAMKAASLMRRVAKGGANPYTKDHAERPYGTSV